MEYQIQVEGDLREVILEEDKILINGEKSVYRVELHNGQYLIYGDKTIFEVTVLEKMKDGFRLLVNGKEVITGVRDHISLLLDKLGMAMGKDEVANEVLAPMPGVILNIMVSEGQEVKKGDPLIILEAMKMENLIKCPADVIIGSISVTTGQNVEKNTSMIRFQ